MKLLDFNLPGMDTAEGQGLLAASLSLMGATKMPGQKGAFGQALAGAGQQYMQTRNTAQEQLHNREVKRLQLDAMKRAVEQENQMRDAARGAFRSPEMANAMSQGPMPDGGAMPQAQPGFDSQKYAQSLYGIDPLKAMDFERSTQKANPLISVPQGGTLYDQQSGKAVFSSPKEASLPSSVQEYNFAKTQGYSGSYEQWATSQKKAGGTSVNTTVSVAGPENEYNKVIGKTLADTGTTLIEAARNAPMVVRNAQQIVSALDSGAITGTGADGRLAVQKFAETLGITKPGVAANTQQLMAGLSQLTLSGIKTSGLGGGAGFTDKDREFLNSAIGGQISDTPENLRRVALLSERAARATHAKGQKVLERWKTNPSLAAVAQDTEMDALPSNTQPKAVVSSLPPANIMNKGKRARDTKTGQILVSDGMQWRAE